MITVSTVSESEAESAAFALHRSLPRDMEYVVYLRGALYRERRARPDDPRLPDAGWPGQAEQRS